MSAGDAIVWGRGPVTGNAAWDALVEHREGWGTTTIRELSAADARFEKAAARCGIQDRGRHFKGLRTADFRPDLLMSGLQNVADAGQLSLF